MKLPSPRGPLSAAVVDRLGGAVSCAGSDLAAVAAARVSDSSDVLHDEDLQLALFVLYELFYRGFEGVEDESEWDLELLGVRRVLEQAFERRLVETVPVPADIEPEVSPWRRRCSR